MRKIKAYVYMAKVVDLEVDEDLDLDSYLYDEAVGFLESASRSEITTRAYELIDDDWVRV